jgi:SH3 domain/IQ calmodulin-binding motif
MAVLCVVRVLQTYAANDDGELSLAVADVVQVIEKAETFWWYGRLRTAEGYFPSSYVEEILLPPTPRLPPPPSGLLCVPSSCGFSSCLSSHLISCPFVALLLVVLGDDLLIAERVLSSLRVSLPHLCTCFLPLPHTLTNSSILSCTSPALPPPIVGLPPPVSGLPPPVIGSLPPPVIGSLPPHLNALPPPIASLPSPLPPLNMSAHNPPSNLPPPVSALPAVLPLPASVNLKAERLAAAVKIQSTFRWVRMRRYFKWMRYSVVLIQSVWRGHHQRKVRACVDLLSCSVSCACTRV